MFPAIASVSVAALLVASPPADADSQHEALGPPLLPRPPSPIAAPRIEQWRPRFEALGPAHREVPYRGFDVLAVATVHDAPIFDRYTKGRDVVGRTFRGSAFSSRSVGRRCYDNGQSGTWYQISTPGRYVCTASGFVIKERDGRLDDQLDPRLDRPDPFEWARVLEHGTPRLSRLPETRAELREILDTDWQTVAREDLPDYVAEIMTGDYFVSLDHEIEVFGETFYKTVRQEYVLSSGLKKKPSPSLMGEHLEDGKTLPLAFVYGEAPAALMCLEGEQWRSCGQAYKHDRMEVTARVEIDGEDYVLGEQGYAVPADRVRVAEKEPRPPGVGADDKWLHVALDQQTITAYEGDEPVFTTLVSSGKEGFETPTGLYRIQRKYTTKIMRALDRETKLMYHIEDIPWIMYYHGGYALHGAFWHNTFGKVRSHGCTNISPPDARWIFNWTAPKMRWGWHATLARGTYIYFDS